MCWLCNAANYTFVRVESADMPANLEHYYRFASNEPMASSVKFDLDAAHEHLSGDCACHAEPETL